MTLVIPKDCKRLAEVDFPIAEVSRRAAREKSIRWELKECLRQHYKSNSPAARRNLEFFVGLRNKIEHRSFAQIDPLDRATWRYSCAR